MKVVTQHFIGTTEKWKEANSLLYEAVWGFEKTADGKVLAKLGNGKDCWNDLKYFDMENIRGLPEKIRADLDEALQAVAEEAQAREQGDNKALEDAKGYTDEHNESAEAHADIRSAAAEEAQARYYADAELAESLAGKAPLKTVLTNAAASASLPAAAEAPLTDILQTMRNNLRSLFASVAADSLRDALRDKFYPVGSIYMSVSSADPATFIGGAWARWGHGRVPMGLGSIEANTVTTYGGNQAAGTINRTTSEEKGGQLSHALTAAQMPCHKHSLSAHSHSVPAGDWHSEGPVRSRHFAAKYCSYNPLDSIPTSTMTPPDSGLTGGNGTEGGVTAHNNMQPYVTCYMWKRTA